MLTPDYYSANEIKPATAEPEEKLSPEVKERIDYATRQNRPCNIARRIFPQIQND